MSLKDWLYQAGPVSRSRMLQRTYIDYLKTVKNDACVFCGVSAKDPEAIIEENKLTYVIKNRFGYTVWDGCAVLEHLMIIPKVHRSSLESFTKKELLEWSEVCARYEQRGYSMYTRSQDNITRSIAHHHTHFIRLANQRKKYIMYIRKPHVLITK